MYNDSKALSSGNPICEAIQVCESVKKKKKKKAHEV